MEVQSGSFEISEKQLERGKTIILREGLMTQSMITLSSGIFLVAYALHMGASNLTVGLLAAIPPLTQLLQIPGVYLVEHYRRRRVICTTATSINRLFLLLIASIPFIATGKIALVILIGGLIMHNAIGAFSLCSWNSWMRDLIPSNQLGSFFGKRMSYSTLVSVTLALLAGYFIDYWERSVRFDIKIAYSILFASAWIFGVIGIILISRIPHVPMTSQNGGKNFFKILLSPLRDKNFRRLIHFLGSWNFAVNLAAPFFTVYMLKRLEMSMTWVIGLTVLSQLINVFFLRIWGKISDRFSNKSVLAFSGPLFLLAVLLWTFTTFPTKHYLTVPILIAIHILLGITMAGVLLATSNIALKLAPKGEATPYMAAATMINSLAAGVAPIIGGRFVDFFNRREFTLDFNWKSPDGDVIIQALNLQSWDFFFFLAFAIGLYSVHRLALVKEEGEVDEKVLRSELFSYIRRPLRNFSTAGGLRFLLHHPIGFFSRINNGETNKYT